MKHNYRKKLTFLFLLLMGGLSVQASGLDEDSGTQKREHATRLEVQQPMANPVMETERLVRLEETTVATETADEVASEEALVETITSTKMTRKEKRALRKEVKTAIRGGEEVNANQRLIAVLLSILFPPLGVAFYEGWTITTNFWIDLILTLLLVYLGGFIFALLVIFDAVNLG